MILLFLVDHIVPWTGGFAPATESFIAVIALGSAIPGSLRVIIVADDASADLGGEAILPLHYYRLLRRRGVEAWLIVHERNRQSLEARLGYEMSRVEFVSDTRIHQLLFRMSATLPDRISRNTFGLLLHLLTQVRQRQILQKKVQSLGIDVVHQPTPVSPKMPSMIFGVGAPVIIGPLNGGMVYPEGFQSRASIAEKMFVPLGRFMAHFLNILIPGKRLANTLLVANERTRKALPIWSSKNIYQMVENGVDLDLFSTDSKPRITTSSITVRCVFIGRLVDWKGVDLLLHAVSQMKPLHGFELHIVGDGDQRGNLESLAIKLGIDNRTTFHGFVPQAECPALLGKMDVMVLPSLLECGGAVVLEGMALGLTVVATKWGGPADYICPRSGRLVDPAGGREVFITRLADALSEIVDGPALRDTMRRHSSQRVENEFSWEKKIDRIIEFYQAAIANTV